MAQLIWPVTFQRTNEQPEDRLQKGLSIGEDFHPFSSQSLNAENGVVVFTPMLQKCSQTAHVPFWVQPCRKFEC